MLLLGSPQVASPPHTATPAWPRRDTRPGETRHGAPADPKTTARGYSSADIRARPRPNPISSLGLGTPHTTRTCPKSPRTCPEPPVLFARTAPGAGQAA